MVGTLVRLQLKLMWRDVKGSVVKIIAWIVALMYLAGLMIGLWTGALFLRGHADVGTKALFTVLLLGVVTLVWPVFTILMFGQDPTLDPGRFALLPVRSRQIQPGLLAASFVSIDGIGIAVLAIASAIAWSSSVLTVVFAIVGGFLGVLTCQLAGRALAASLAQALARRRARDLVTGLVMVGVLIFAVAINLLSQAMTHGGGIRIGGPGSVAALRQAASIIAWTPFGWVWALPGDAASGAWIELIVRLVLGAALVAGLWRWWGRSLDRAMVSPLLASGGGALLKGSGRLASRLPDTPAGAIAWRSLLYWRRDARHLVQILTVLVFPVLITVPLLTQPKGDDGRSLVVVLAPVVLGIMAMTITTGEISYDGSALWHEIVSGVRGRDDRWGRVMATGMILVPIVVLVAVGAATLTGGWDMLTLGIGTGLGAVGLALGVGSVISAVWQQAVPPAGSNIFAAKQTGNIQVFLGVMLGLAALGGLAIPPAVVLVGMFLAEGEHFTVWTTLVGAVIVAVYGALMCWLGVRWGGSLLAKRWPETLKAITYNG